MCRIPSFLCLCALFLLQNKKSHLRSWCKKTHMCSWVGETDSALLADMSAPLHPSTAKQSTELHTKILALGTWRQGPKFQGHPWLPGKFEICETLSQKRKTRHGGTCLCSQPLGASHPQQKKKKKNKFPNASCVQMFLCQNNRINKLLLRNYSQGLGI